MLDFDLAELYGVSTTRLNEQVRRNLKRFPSDFMLSLTKQELAGLISQIAISNKGRGGRRKPPLAFTEQGISMLSAVLHSDQAIEANIAIMRAFVKIRMFAISHKELAIKIKELEKKYDGQFNVVFAALEEIMSEHAVPRKRILGLGTED